MNVEALAKKFEQIVFSMSDEELVNEFAEMGCKVEVASPAEENWSDSVRVSSETQSHYSTRPLLTKASSSQMAYAADSNELALAA